MRYMNRGAVLVILWTLLPYSLSAISKTFINAYVGSNLVYVVVASISIPVFDCLSDILLGCYTIIHYGLWLLWEFLIITSMQMIVKPYTAMENRSLQWTEYLVAGFTVIGMWSSGQYNAGWNRSVRRCLIFTNLLLHQLVRVNCSLVYHFKFVDTVLLLWSKSYH